MIRSLYDVVRRSVMYLPCNVTKTRTKIFIKMYLIEIVNCEIHSVSVLREFNSAQYIKTSHEVRSPLVSH